VTIADQGSVTAAATALGLPKSTVSRRLADLELLLRTSPFRRSTRALSLTDEGRSIYDMAKPSIAAADNAARAIAERERLVAGHVSLTTTAAFGQYLIAPHLIKLTAAYSDVQVELRLTERRANIIGYGIDLAVRMGTLDDSDLVAPAVFARSDASWWLPLSISKRPGRRWRLQTLPHTMRSSPARRSIPGALIGDSECSMRWTIAAGNMLVAHQLAHLDHGIALLPDFMLEAGRRG
jgi:DNA-binding transcriptional LysR family regulator